MTVKQRVGCGAMSGLPSAIARRRALLRRRSLAAGAVALALAAMPAAASAGEVAPDLGAPVPDLVSAVNQEPPRLAYLTETASGAPKVWIAAADGSGAKLLGPGQQPLLAPNGQAVAVALFGTANGPQEHGPAIGIYPSSGAAIADYLSLEAATATPLAWSPDSRYLAVYAQSNGTAGIAAASSLDVIDTQTGTVATIAHGAIYGASFARDGSDRLVYALAHSLSPSAKTNLYVAEAGGAGVHPITSDGHSLLPVWGPAYIAYDRERARRLSPEYQIWLGTLTNPRVRKLTDVRVGSLLQGLVPLAFSADGARLLAEFEGEDTSEAYAVDVATGRARGVRVDRQEVQAGGISSDGSTLLLDTDSFEQAPSRGRIVTQPWGGGSPTVLVAHGGQASWND
jgi:Tol biopolymer transport system component